MHTFRRLLFILFSMLTSAGRAPAQDDVAGTLRALLARETVRLAGSEVPATRLREFYHERGYRPAWLTHSGAPRVAALREAVRGAANDALDPDDYPLDAIDMRLGAIALGIDDASIIAETELLLSTTFLALATHRASGRVDPRTLHEHWTLTPRTVDPVSALGRALGNDGVATTLQSLDPTDPQFERLRAALLRYRTLSSQSPWPRIPDGPVLEEGLSDARVSALRARLDAEDRSHDAAGTWYAWQNGLPARDSFDAALATRVRAYQTRHGLDADGRVGPRTLAALNVPLAARVGQIALNLERLRWFDSGEERRIEVRIPEFVLRAYDAGRETLSMRVVAGRPDWPSPVFRGIVQDITLNPWWNVPERILREELLPAIRRDPGYLEKHDMEIVAASGEIVAASNIDWTHIAGRGFPYRIRQRPGPDNPLGRIRITLASGDLGVHLHDTPLASAFARADRALSHGCIRVQQPLELAAFVLGDQTQGSRDHLAAKIATGATTRIFVEPSVPVYVLYATAWVDARGEVQFRDDLYGHDGALARWLSVPGPALSSGSHPTPPNRPMATATAMAVSRPCPSD